MDKVYGDLKNVVVEYADKLQNGFCSGYQCDTCPLDKGISELETKEFNFITICDVLRLLKETIN